MNIVRAQSETLITKISICSGALLRECVRVGVSACAGVKRTHAHARKRTEEAFTHFQPESPIALFRVKSGCALHSEYYMSISYAYYNI